MQPIIGALILPLAMVAWAAPAHEPDYDFDESFLDDLFEDVQTFKENMKTGDQQSNEAALRELEEKHGVVGLKNLEAKALEAIKALEEIQKKQEREDNVKRLAFELEVAEALAQKPETCEATIRGCAVAYESHDCNGGWKLPIGEEEMKFKWFTKTQKYRNDIDVIAVKANCTFIGFEDSSFNGVQMKLPAKPYDRWVVLADSLEFRHMDEDIESLKCFCDGS